NSSRGRAFIPAARSSDNLETVPCFEEYYPCRPGRVAPGFYQYHSQCGTGDEGTRQLETRNEFGRGCYRDYGYGYRPRYSTGGSRPPVRAEFFDKDGRDGPRLDDC